ncbi:LysR substrate-binding domain-containing protein [Pseudomonas sp. BN606]|uniref:LysR substrate-binding domain-containing protein n=1 Tax=Pseudomonas sp. BN606 TaxID=2567894 RepID=UPI00245868D5|nr:LysR substrate-binding domain-containing protein [Pseudomonas sp. BN606]MDH4654883.1 LysR family transcriptional regulator [Pseudomonas sp. BN606]
MKINQLRDIVTVAEKGGLRAAARHLGLAQPAITRSIREAERELGTTLFERRTTGIVPTEIGRHYLQRARAILLDMERARDEVRQMLGEQVGSVSFALSTVSHLALLPMALDAFRQRYPDVRLNLVEGLLPRVQAGLESGELDFYIGPLSEHALPKSLGAELLFEQLRVVLGRRGHPLSEARSLAELVDARWISTSVTETTDAELGPLFARHGLPSPRVDLHAQSAFSMLMAAASSDLLCMLPEQFLRYPATQQTLSHIQVREVLPAPSVYAVRRSQVVLTPAAQFLHELLARAANLSRR